MKFPLNQGLTASAFINNKMIYQNGEKLERNFYEIDNIHSYGYIRSFAFAPLYGYNNKKIGILQLYNKKNENIGKEALKVIKAFQKTLGIIIDEIIEFNNSLDFIVNSKITMRKIINRTEDYTNEALVMLI